MLPLALDTPGVELRPAAGDQASPWLTVAGVAARAACGHKLVYREIRAGRLRAARIGGRRDLRIHRNWVDRWLEASAGPVER